MPAAISPYGPYGFSGYQRYLAAGGQGPLTAHLQSIDAAGSSPPPTGPLAAAAGLRAPDVAAEIMASAGLTPTQPARSPVVAPPPVTTDPDLLAFDMAAEIIAIGKAVEPTSR